MITYTGRIEQHIELARKANCKITVFFGYHVYDIIPERRRIVINHRKPECDGFIPYTVSVIYDRLDLEAKIK